MALRNPSYFSLLDILKQYWISYRLFIKKATTGSRVSGTEDIKYWRDRLFTRFITWLLPICLIALVPSVYMGIKQGYLFIVIVDLFSVTSIVGFALGSKIELATRKVIIVFLLYCLSAILLFYLGLLGPGFVYLLAICIFTSLILPYQYSYFAILANLVICVLGSLVIYFGAFNSPLIKEFTVPVWITVSSNLVFLSAVCVLLINYVINSLETTIIKQSRLKDQLHAKGIERMRNILLLKESEGHYKSLFFHGPSPMLVLDNESSKFLQVNEAAIESYGFNAEEFLNMCVEDIKVEVEDFEGLDLPPSPPKKRASSQIEVTQHRRKNGDTFYAEVMLNAIPFRGKQATLVITRDLTEQIKYINAIEHQNKKLQDISYIQSHLVRAPFARIMGLVELVRINNFDKIDPEILAYLDQSAKEFDEIIASIVNNAEQTTIN